MAKTKNFATSVICCKIKSPKFFTITYVFRPPDFPDRPHFLFGSGSSSSRGCGTVISPCPAEKATVRSFRKSRFLRCASGHGGSGGGFSASLSSSEGGDHIQPLLEFVFLTVRFCVRPLCRNKHIFVRRPHSFSRVVYSP